MRLPGAGAAGRDETDGARPRQSLYRLVHEGGMSADSIWMEKYRPKSLDEVLGQPLAVERLKAFASGEALPHILLSGPPGSGKTTCALIVASGVLKGMLDGNYLELSASDLTKARPVDQKTDDGDGNTVVKTVVKRDSSPLWRIREFASTTSLDGVGFRVVLIDEVDTLSRPVQQALRRTMEVYSGNCAFILACNHPSMLIDPLRSRCAHVTFRPIPSQCISERISYVAEAEGVELEEGAADGIAMASEGDMRRALCILQAAASSKKTVDLDTVFGLTETPAVAVTDTMLKDALKGDIVKARESLDRMLIEGGMSGREIMEIVHSRALALGLPDQDTVRLIDKIGEIDHRIAECGSNGTDSPIERVQIEHLLAYLAMTGRRRRRFPGTLSER